jgi:hypothetical protein
MFDFFGVIAGAGNLGKAREIGREKNISPL